MIATDENADKSSVYSAKGFGSDGNYTQVFEIHAGLHLCESTENTTKSVKVWLNIRYVNQVVIHFYRCD